MFEMTENIINPAELMNRFDNPKVGGLVTFEGRVRNHNDGLEVNSLEYSSYISMATKEGQKIVEEAKEKFELEDLYCVHRVGHLQIKEIAVWAIACSKHRREAFRACEYIVDNIKSRVPIWKKEHYASKEATWINCHRCAEHTHTHE